MLESNSTTRSLEQFVDRIFASYQLTNADQKILMSALMAKDSLSQADRALIDRVYQGLQKGLLRLTE